MMAREELGQLPARSESLRSVKEKVIARIRILLQEHISLVSAHIQQQRSGNSFIATVVDTLNMLINSICSVFPIRYSNVTVQNLLAPPPPPPKQSSTAPMGNGGSGGAITWNAASVLQKLNGEARETARSIDAFHRHQLLTQQPGVSLNELPSY
jgi:hypothetical protein